MGEFPWSLAVDRTSAFVGIWTVAALCFRLRQRRLENEIAQEQLNAILDNTNVLINVKDLDGRYLLSSRQLEQIIGVTRENLRGMTDHEVFRREIADARCASDRSVLEEQEPSQYEEIIPVGGEPQTWISTKVPLFDSSASPYGVCSISTNISDRTEIEERLSSLALYDSLTQLANRSFFLERLRNAIARAKRAEDNVFILLLDLDHFKDTNDTLGHTIGDRLLTRVAERLQATTRDSDTVARLGGDEFAIIANNTPESDGAATLACRVMGALSDPFLIEEHEVYISASIGITMYPMDGHSPEQLLKSADLALYHAKAESRGGYQFYDSELNQRTSARKMVESELRKALHRNEMLLYYQPRVDIKTGDMVGAEALVRWLHPEKGLIPPNEFISVAESSELIVPLGSWVLKTACDQHVAWLREGLPPITVAVNLSAVQFKSTSLIETVERVIEDSGIDPNYLEIEITESVIMDRIDEVMKDLHWFHDQGIKLSIDDFGTGYSSLAYLKRFPVDNLKIDRSFVRDVTEDPADAAIVNTIVTLGKNLGLEVIAEGVETAAQLEFLCLQGCTQAQGYYFCRPVPSDRLAEWYRRHDQRRLDLAI